MVAREVAETRALEAMQELVTAESYCYADTIESVRKFHRVATELGKSSKRTSFSLGSLANQLDCKQMLVVRHN